MVTNDIVCILVLLVQSFAIGWLLGFTYDKDWASLIQYDNTYKENKDPHITYLKARRKGK